MFYKNNNKHIFRLHFYIFHSKIKVILCFINQINQSNIFKENNSHKIHQTILPIRLVG